MNITTRNTLIAGLGFLDQIWEVELVRKTSNILKKSNNYLLTSFPVFAI